jgi:hypothetical protein
MPESWRGGGPRYEVEWGGIPWELRLDERVPGLYAPRLPLGPVLGLEGLRAVGRSAPGALGGASLVAHETIGPVLSATCAPLGWGALWVQVRWVIIGADTIDLLVEIQARTVGRLHGLEVVIVSALGPQPEAGSHRSIEPRDARAAALTYDGRENDLAALVTGPPGMGLPPWLVPRAGREGWTYAEFGHADDVSRRILEGRLPFHVARHALFGYDLEKGVVLRARLRAAWLPKATAMTEVERRFDAFRREPLPLSI